MWKRAGMLSCVRILDAAGLLKCVWVRGSATFRSARDGCAAGSEWWSLRDANPRDCKKEADNSSAAAMAKKSFHGPGKLACVQGSNLHVAGSLLLGSMKVGALCWRCDHWIHGFDATPCTEQSPWGETPPHIPEGFSQGRLPTRVHPAADWENRTTGNETLSSHAPALWRVRKGKEVRPARDDHSVRTKRITKPPV